MNVPVRGVNMEVIIPSLFLQVPKEKRLLPVPKLPEDHEKRSVKHTSI